jgi:hypothetical protein
MLTTAVVFSLDKTTAMNYRVGDDYEQCEQKGCHVTEANHRVNNDLIFLKTV